MTKLIVAWETIRATTYEPWGEATGLREVTINVAALWRPLAEKTEARSKS
jgi:hypothetical protein